MTSTCGPEIFGADPAILKWQVVRGDTSILRVEFYENDEATAYETSEWTFQASAYDFANDITDELEVTPGEGFVTITAPSDITAQWGEGFKRNVAELSFDLEVTVDRNTTWTPVVGTISVIGDVTRGTL